MHKTLRERPIDRLIEERTMMSPLPAAPETDRRWVLRVPPDPYLRFDTCDYSLDPALVGRRVEARVSEREVLAVALDTGELACRHPRSFARHRTITALEHARTLKVQREERRGGAGRRGPLARPLRPADRMTRPDATGRRDMFEATVLGESRAFVKRLDTAEHPRALRLLRPRHPQWPYWQRELRRALPLLLRDLT